MTSDEISVELLKGLRDTLLRLTADDGINGNVLVLGIADMLRSLIEMNPEPDHLRMLVLAHIARASEVKILIEANTEH